MKVDMGKMLRRQRVSEAGVRVGVRKCGEK